MGYRLWRVLLVLLIINCKFRVINCESSAFGQKFPTGYYRLVAKSGGVLYQEALHPKVSSVHSGGVESVVRIEQLENGGVYLKLQGLYIAAPTRNQAVCTTVVPTVFYVTEKEDGTVAFSTRRGTYNALACANTTGVVGATLSDENAYWTVTPAEEFTYAAGVSKDGKYYGAFYSPVAAKLKDTEAAQAFEMTEQDGKAVASKMLTEVGEMEPVLLRSEEKNVEFEIVDKEAGKVYEGNRVLRNDYADLSYKYFNKAFLLNSGDKNDYTFYREFQNTKDKLYFWQQALVIMMVEDRYQFRGDRQTASLIIELLDAFMAQEGSSKSTLKAGISDWTWNEYNDDLLWAGLAFVRGYLITGQQRFLDQAEWVWGFMYDRGWDETLGGGIWWSVDKEEKSGLSNNPAVCMACYLYDATGKQDYLDKAVAIHDWVCKKLRNTDGSVDEKINADGSLARSYNVYNQGTFIEGTAALQRITGNTQKYRTLARNTIKYVMTKLVNSDGIMSRWKSDGTWQSEFARGMAFYLQANPDDWSYQGVYTSSQKKITYYNWLRLNADRAWETRDTVNNITGCQWDRTTPTTPENGKTWECDACVSAVVMTNVVPQVIPGSAEEEYIVYDDDDDNSRLTYMSSTAQNVLRGTTQNLTAVDGAAVLKNGSDGLGFYPVTATTVIKANAAYLPESRTLLIDLESLDKAPTGVGDVENTDGSTELTNHAGNSYDLAGRKVSGDSGENGVVIKNGKKALMRR